MLNSDTEQKMYKIPASTSQDYHSVNLQRGRNKNTIVYMSYLTEEEEEKIDNFKGEVFKLCRGERTFSISPRQIYCYGEVDFDSEDADVIDEFDFLNYLGAVGVRVMSGYNYDEHCYYSPKPYPLWSETWRPLELVLRAHGALGKPQRIILFKQVYDSIQKKLSR